MTASITPANSPTPKRSFGLFRLIAAAVIAAIANFVVFFLSGATGTTITTFGKPMGAYEPIVASLVPIVLAGLIVWLLLPYWRWAGRIAPVAGGIVAALTAIAPLTIVGGASGLWLAPMHIIAGAAWYLGTRPQHLK
ncbi:MULTISPECIES: DUF6069 family protein [Bifidobacterium]|jgi:hypothetical protein|uniref:Uncharacterized protein n=1 Tax=Bifidobacterium tibiigranuli TaxID=2172043 RepID=A0A5N6S5I4_9BIFI|nr:DUF6069 family protein [Bifidobacterium tibiigranuli]KAE8128760.1 hypothetical protein DDE84_04695 [Bifidobacterium tibiigranuli]KAE8128951.1 hypothetical protein DDF78_04485 [Bifidobacterium tibiigranuli]MCI1211372.1 DUF6069 family protein [Bifidobacterium tibiigranuli]MCI1254421.1 DUF6069 family protein [Bifidobacterium tibiigranuli]